MAPPRFDDEARSVAAGVSKVRETANYVVALIPLSRRLPPVLLQSREIDAGGMTGRRCFADAEIKK